MQTARGKFQDIVWAPRGQRLWEDRPCHEMTFIVSSQLFSRVECIQGAFVSYLLGTFPVLRRLPRERGRLDPGHSAPSLFSAAN